KPRRSRVRSGGAGTEKRPMMGVKANPSRLPCQYLFSLKPRFFLPLSSSSSARLGCPLRTERPHHRPRLPHLTVRNRFEFLFELLSVVRPTVRLQHPPRLL